MSSFRSVHLTRDHRAGLRTGRFERWRLGLLAVCLAATCTGCGGRKSDAHSAERLHRLRIAIKKLRYAADFLRPAFASRASKAYIEATTRLQGALGDLNDRAMANETIAGLAAAARPTENVERDLRKLAKQAASGEKRRRHRLERAWRKFKHAERFWEVTAKP